MSSNSDGIGINRTALYLIRLSISLQLVGQTREIFVESLKTDYTTMLRSDFNSIHDVPKLSGIYCIQNVLNGHKYIGSTKNFRSRFYQHRYLLQNNKHHSPHLQSAYNKYGEDKFIFIILESCEPIRDTLILIEQKYLDLKPEYNCAELASCPAKLHQSQSTKDKRAKKLKGQKRSEEFKKRLSEITMNKVGKMVDQFDLNGNYIRTFNSTAQAARSLGDFTTRGVGIQECCKNKSGRYKQYQWRWTSDNYASIGIDKYTNGSMKVIDNLKKRIYKCDLNDNIICMYGSISDAVRDLNIGRSMSNVHHHIMQSINLRDGEAFGFKWKLVNYHDEHTIIQKCKL